MRTAIFIALLITIQVTKAQSPEFQHKIAVAAYIEHRGLQMKSDFTRYYQEIRGQVAQSVESQRYYEAFLKMFNSQKVDNEKQKNLYLQLAYGGGLKEAAIVYLMVKQDKNANELEEELKDQFLSEADALDYYDSTIENYSAKSTKTLTAETFNIGTDILVAFTGPAIPGMINVNTANFRDTETLKHCLRQLMQDYRLPDCTVTLREMSENIKNKNLSPLNIYMTMTGKNGNRNNHYYGGFAPTGKLRSWGHLPEFYKSLKDVKKQLVAIPVTDIENLKDSVLLYGTDILAANSFVGASTIKELSEKKITESVDLYNTFREKLSAKQFKSNNELLSSLNGILKVNPNHFSALLYKELLQKKFRPKVTLMNSYFEFESAYHEFNKLNLLEAARGKNSPSADKIQEIDDKLKKLSKNCHPDMRLMCKLIISLIDNYRDIRKEVAKKNETSIQNGIMSYYKDLRVLNLKRDMLIDSRKALDGIFIR